MTSQKAIQILNEQIESVRLVTEQTHKTWVTQTKSEIEAIFGIGSTESLFLITFHFVEHYSQESVMSQIGKSRLTAIDFLRNCIKTIERRIPEKQPDPVIKYVDRPGKEIIKEVMVYPPKVNYFWTFIKWIKRQDVLALIGSIIAILGLPFSLGWLLATNKGDIKNYELSRDNKQLKNDTAYLGSENRQLKDSLRAVPFNISNSKSDSNAKSDKKQQITDSTHK
jgi:hypothetical protein